MIRSTAALANQKFDLAIIGGGITGACLALDAVSRGLSVALIEKADFGGATSSASSKLLHGGVRYLQQLRLGKVRESALERVYFQTLAPHLTSYVPFLIPTYAGISKSRVLMESAMLIYQAICAGQNRTIAHPSKKVPPPESLDRRRVQAALPDGMAEGMTGAVVLYESHVHSTERLTLAFLQTAARLGAAVCNYVMAESFLRRGDSVAGIRARDLQSGEVIDLLAGIVINATGPWIPFLNQEFVASKNGLVTAYSRGAHVVVPEIISNYALALPTINQNEAIINRGGRHVFAIPWRGHTLIGTSYGPHKGSLDNLRPNETEIGELIEDFNGAAGVDLVGRDEVRYAFAGIYPLVSDEVKPDTYQGTGDYQVVDHGAAHGIRNYFSVFGAKYTTARLLAERALDQISPAFGRSVALCGTRSMVLDGGDIGELANFTNCLISEFAGLLLPETCRHLAVNYGTLARQITERVRRQPALGARLHQDHPVILAEIDHAAENESVCHLEDFVFRRTGLGTLGHPGADCLRGVAARLATHMDWSAHQIDAEIERTERGFEIGVER